jgi:YD repeat-containing protein
MQVAGQTAISYTYDHADRLTGVTQGSASVTIAYDTADRRTSLTLPNGIVVEYGYDAASQLTGLTYKLGGTTLGNLAYTYDTARKAIDSSPDLARCRLADSCDRRCRRSAGSTTASMATARRRRPDEAAHQLLVLTQTRGRFHW